MIGFAKFNTLVLTYYWILCFSQLNFSFGYKPHCKGEALDQAEFTDKGTIGFIINVYVDLIARNFYDKLQYSASKLCDDLANTHTATCVWGKCLRWRRWFPFIKGVISRIMTTSEELMNELNDVALKKESLNDADEKFMFDRINEAKSELIDSGVITEGSHLADQLDDMKNYVCTRYQLHLHQKAHQESIQKDDAETMEKFNTLLKNEDLIMVVKQFIRNRQVKCEMKILKYFIDERIVKSIGDEMSNIIRLRFEYRDSKGTKSSRVILKIPSLDSRYESLKTDKSYDREAYTYEKVLLPTHAIKNFIPVAPELFAASHGSALALEDISVDQYKHYDDSSPLDLEHTQISLQMLARYHAIGYKYLRSTNKDDPTMLLMKSFHLTKMFPVDENDFNRFCKWVEPLVSPPLFEKIKNAENQILATTTPSLPKENSFTTIIHGDLNPGNIFFKNDNTGKEIMAKIIDFEFAREESLVVDFIDFLVQNVDISVFQDNDDALLDSYVGALNDALKLLNAQRKYSRQDLYEDIVHNKYGLFRRFVLLCKGGEAYTQIESTGEESNQYMPILISWITYLDGKGLLGK